MNKNIIMFFSILLLLIFMLFTKIKTKKLLTLNIIYTFIWIIIMFFSMNNSLGLLEPRTDIYVTVLFSIIIFNIVYIILYFKRNEEKEELKENFHTNDKLIIFLNFICYIIILPYLIKAIKILLSSGFDLDLVRDTIYVGINNSNNVVYTLISRTLPTAYFTFVELISSYYLIVKKNKKIVKLGFLNVLIGTVIFGGRNFLLNYAIFYFFNYLCITNKKIKIKKRYIILVILFLYIVTKSRTASKVSFFQTIILYYAGSLSFLEYILQHPMMYGLETKHYGYLTFGFITEPIALMLKGFLGLNIKVPSYYFNIYSQEFVNIGKYPTIQLYNTNSTLFYPFALDFGFNFALIGFLIYVCLICFVNYKKNKGNIKYHLLYVYLCSTVVNSSINYKLIGVNSTLMIIFIMLAIKKEARKNE